MWVHLLSILGLVALCSGWVLFQLWLKRQDPDLEKRCGNCGSCGCELHEGSETEGTKPV